MSDAPDQRPMRRHARRLALARLISMSGGMASAIALAAVLYERTRSPAWVAAGALATSLVAGIATPLTGALADRLDRRRLMIASDLAAAAAFGVLGVLVWREAPPGVLVATAALGAICEAPFVPASRAALPNLVADDDLPWANGLLGQVSGLSGAVGPLVGGTLTALVSGAAAMGVNAASFIASALLVAAIGGRFRRTAPDAAAGARRGAVREGIRFVARDRLLRAIMVSGFVAFIGVGFVIAANPAFADAEGAGPVGLGALWAGWGIGAIVGAGFVPRLLSPGREVAVAAAGFALQAAALASASVLPFWVVVCAQTLGGLGGGMADPARHTLVQRRADDAIRGRVASLMEAIGWSSFAVSLVAAGALVEDIGVRTSYAVAGGLFAVGTALMVLLAGRAALGTRRSARDPAHCGKNG